MQYALAFPDDKWKVRNCRQLSCFHAANIAPACYLALAEFVQLHLAISFRKSTERLTVGQLQPYCDVFLVILSSHNNMRQAANKVC